MMNPAIPFVLAAVIFGTFLLAGNYMNAGDWHQTVSGEPFLTTSIDKEVYKSSDQMELNVTILGGGDVENLTVRIYGIPGKGGAYRVNSERQIEIGADEEITEQFHFTVPSCYGCAGVSPGEYEIITEILRNGTVITNSTQNVTLEK